MMSQEEIQVVKVVYERFIDSESEGWGDLDDNLEFFDWLNDRELIDETKVKQIGCSKGIRCASEHDIGDCFAPYIFEAVTAILNLWDKTRMLHKNNRYILLYYLSMSEMDLIFEISDI
jgi:hypothetical protein